MGRSRRFSSNGSTKWMIAGKIDSGALRGASGHHRLVFLFRLAGKKNPHGVDAHRGSERNIEQRDEGEDECHGSGPRLALQQTPSRDKSQSSLAKNEYPNHAEQRMQEGRSSRPSSGREERVRDDIQNHAANRIQGREGQPENSQQMNMPLHSSS